jgi:hypothetical protein
VLARGSSCAHDSLAEIPGGRHHATGEMGLVVGMRPNRQDRAELLDAPDARSRRRATRHEVVALAHGTSVDSRALATLSCALFVVGVGALTVLPTVYFLGCATYVRLVECGAEDLRYGMAINRIRGYYKELADDRAYLFLLSGHDDAAGVFLNMGIAPDRRSPAFAFSTTIAVVNGVVGGAVAALALGAIPNLPLWLATVVGVIVAAASIIGWVRFAGHILDAAARQVTPLFPSPSPSPSPD